MSMSPENYNGLEKRSKQLLNDISNILNEENVNRELQAVEVYDRIVALEAELNIAIKNLKIDRKKGKYERYLNDILEYKEDVYFIAHIM